MVPFLRMRNRELRGWRRSCPRYYESRLVPHAWNERQFIQGHPTVERIVVLESSNLPVRERIGEFLEECSIYPTCYGAPYSRLQGFYCSRWMGRPSVVSLPFPFSSKRREGRLVAPGAGTNKDRRQRTPTVGALISEGFSSETDPAAPGRSLPSSRSEFDAGTLRNTDLMVRRKTDSAKVSRFVLPATKSFLSEMIRSKLRPPDLSP